MVFGPIFIALTSSVHKIALKVIRRMASSTGIPKCLHSCGMFWSIMKNHEYNILCYEHKDIHDYKSGII